jgi:polar amino acid transport system substrate-binding protein
MLRGFRQLWIAWLVLVCSATAASAYQGIEKSSVLEHIQKVGQIRVGVKTDVHPFGFLDKNGQPVGLELDMAADIARRLGVDLIMVPVRTDNRFQKLELGEVDILIATVGDSLQRRQVATVIEPAYFQAGVTVMLRPGLALSDWNAIRGKTVCALQGAYFNRPTAERYLLTLQTYKTVRDALLAVKDGHCDGYLYNRPVIQRYLADPDYADFTAPFPDALVAPWAIFIGKDQARTDLEIFLGDSVADWYRTGFIQTEAEKWGVRYGSDWPAPQVELWNRKTEDGAYLCQRDAEGRWPAVCRRTEFVTSTEVSGLAAFGLQLKENFGLDISYIYDTYDRSQVIDGLLMTFAITLATIVSTLVLGVVAATVIEAQIPLLSRAVLAFMAMVRFTPPILMMYLLFFGIGGLLLTHYGFKVPAFLVAIFCLASYSGGIVVSALRDAANHLRRADPAFSLSFSRLGEAIDYARWPIKQALINGTKMSMICSAIAIPEILSAATAVMTEKGNFAVMMLSLVVVYYGVTSFWIAAFNGLEVLLYGRPNAAGRAKG